MLTFAVSCAVAVLGTRAVIPLLRRAAVMDVPNARSSHKHVVPRGGGIGVLLGISAAVLVSGVAFDARVVLVAGLAAAALGLADDLRSLPAQVRLGVQVVIAAAVATLLLRDEAHSPVAWVAALLTVVIWLVGYLNAFNFMDGINGISGASAVVAGGWYAWVGHVYDSRGLLVIGLALAGASLGFLPWNALQAKVFLGDVGSYGLGMLIAGLALLALISGVTVAQSAAPLVLYLADTAWALIKRVSRGDSWHEAHREHVYQRLVDRGWSHPATTVFVAVLASVACAVVVVAPGLWAIAGVGTIALAYLTLPAIMPRRERVSQ